MPSNNFIKWSPKDYADAAIIAREAENELKTRLDWLSVNPRVVVDIGCGIGNASEELKKRYPQAQIISIDNCIAMLKHMQKRNTLSKNCICADADLLPFADMQIDLIFANFLIPWHPHFELLLQECSRVLREEGVLLLSALGLDTFSELKPYVDTSVFPFLLDMHDLGDALLENKFIDPVLDVSHVNVSYRSNSKLIQDLIGSGMLKSADLNGLEDDKTAPIQELTYEVIYAHAFAPSKEARANRNGGEVNVSLAQFRQMVSTKR